MLRQAQLLRASLAGSHAPRLLAARLASTDQLGGSVDWLGTPSAAPAAAGGGPIPHAPLGPLQRLGVAVASAVGASLDPSRADLVAALGETTGELALRRMLARMEGHPMGRQILAERPRITDATLAAARRQAPGTLGAAYAAFMDSRGFSASERPQVKYVSSPALAYVAQRNREVHDLWHVLFGCHTNILGELALKGLEFVQTGLPMAALSVAGASWRLRPEARRRLGAQLLPWALRAGLSARDLMCIHYERHMGEDLAALRREWGILPAPDTRMRAARPRQ